MTAIRTCASIICATGLLASCSPDGPDREARPPLQASLANTPEPPTPPTSETTRTAGAVVDAPAESRRNEEFIPARFHGDFSEDLTHCGTPGHQRYAIRAREVGFFESRGIVQDVNVNGDDAAVTLSEQYGDAPPSIYTLYMAIEGPDTMRIRYDKEPRFPIYRCP